MLDPDPRWSCTRKKAYSTKKQAQLVVNAISKREPKAHLHVYGCPLCGQYHVGRKLRGQDQV